MSGINPLGLSDEDFLKLNEPPPVTEAVTPTPVVEEEEEVEEQEEKPADEGEGTPPPEDEKPAEEEKEEEEVPEGSDKSDESATLSKDKSQEPDKSESTKPAATGEKDTDKSKTETVTPPDYEGFYKSMMSFRANGKTIELKTPEEAKQLMQMGANYTRKMQDLAPHRKILLMLQNNKLLDEGKLSFLIDIEKKNPEAIKKLLKDAGIDPLDLDTSGESTYREGNHRVTDEEAGFRAALDELTSSNPEGKETLKVINTQWDQASKDILWKQPEVLALIHQQRETGIYDLVTTEMERLRTLGAIPPNTPFLHAYKKIGDDLAEAGKFNHLAKPAPETTPQKEPVVTRKATPKPEVKSGDKASAASTTRTTARKAETAVNPLALSDDDFMKEVAKFEGRL